MTIFRLFDMRVRVNPYFLLLLLVLGFVDLLIQALILFAVVLIHEASHAVTAKLCGLEVVEIELLPFGGVARIDGLIELDPSAEIKVAIMGPASNALLIGLMALVSVWWDIPPDFKAYFYDVNLWIGGFNLLPALPLDGGRILRAKLTQRIGFRRATAIAAMTGKVCAVLMLMVGIIFFYWGKANVSLIVVAFFVFIAAGKENSQAAFVLLRYLTRKRSQAMRSHCVITHHLAASGKTPIKEVMKHFVPSRFHVLWVVDEEGRLISLVAESELIDAVFERGTDVCVEELGRPI